MPLRFTLRQLEYLVAVGECGSISQAAEKLSVSPPSISTSIAQLEAEFGFPIFVRKHAQGMSLTRDGRVFLAEAQAVLRDADRLNDLANDITGRVRGPFKVGCLQTFAQIVLPQLRRSFVDRYPELFARTPWLPLLGNHDREIRPRGPKPPAMATAVRTVMPSTKGNWPALLTSPSTKKGRNASTSTETRGSRMNPLRRRAAMTSSTSCSVRPCTGTEPMSGIAMRPAPSTE